jgi:alcohol dehydrogenase (cytochrome c)
LNRQKDGKIGFVDGQPFVNQTAFKGLDPNTGRPIINPDQKPSTGKSTMFCPSLWGGKDWPPGAFNPETRMLYIPTNDNLCSTLTAGPVTYTPGQRFTHGGSTKLHLKDGATFIGEVQAWNVDTGKKAWSVPFAKSPNWGPILTTAGGLVFSGGTNDRKFRAFDATTGKILWEQVTPSGITAMPASYTVDGKQYITVQSGWGIDPRAKQRLLNELRPGQFPPVPEGGSIWVYALD